MDNKKSNTTNDANRTDFADEINSEMDKKNKNNTK